MINRLILLSTFTVMAIFCYQTTYAQLRVVTHNTLAKPATTAEQALARTIYGAIGGRAANGIAKRPDLVALQEQQTGFVGTTDQMILALEAEFGVSSYEKVLLSLGTLRQSYVYDSSILTPVASSEIFLGIRVGLRTEWQLVGYDANSRFYTYCVHYKAGDGSGNLFQRNQESTNLRTDADALGDGTPIIYMGDFNFSGHTEASVLTLTAAGNGQAFDPVQLTAWPDLLSREYLTQSTRAISLPDGGAFGGIDDRFDLQLITDELLDGDGISYMGPSSSGFMGVEHSYIAFGNDGLVYNVAINALLTGREQPANVLNALHDFSDHLPVVADYQFPARMEVTVDPVSAALIVGATASVDFDVANTAPVALEVAADELNYSFFTSGDLSGSGGGTDPAAGGVETESFGLDTATVGAKSGTLTVDGLSQQTSDPQSVSNVNFDVLDHANPSFSNLMDEDSLLIDLGDVALGAAPAGTSISIHNLPSAFGAALTADLDLDSITETDPDGKFSVSGPLFDNLAAGQNQSFTLDVVADQPGMFTAMFDFNLSDEDLPGQSTHSITLMAMMNVVAGVLGDMNGDGEFNNFDISPFVLALTDPPSFAAQYPDVNVIIAGDFNGDESFDNLDITGFVAALSGGS